MLAALRRQGRQEGGRCEHRVFVRRRLGAGAGWGPGGRAADIIVELRVERHSSSYKHYLHSYINVVLRATSKHCLNLLGQRATSTRTHNYECCAVRGWRFGPPRVCIAAALPAPSVELLHVIVPLCGEFLNILVLRFLPLPLLFLGLSCRLLLPAKRIVRPRPPRRVWLVLRVD